MTNRQLTTTLVGLIVVCLLAMALGRGVTLEAGPLTMTVESYEVQADGKPPLTSTSGGSFVVTGPATIRARLPDGRVRELRVEAGKTRRVQASGTELTVEPSIDAR